MPKAKDLVPSTESIQKRIDDIGKERLMLDKLLEVAKQRDAHAAMESAA